MARIELGPIPMKVQQCEHCGRIRGEDGIWKHAPGVIADVIVTCATCGDWQKKVRAIREARLMREAKARVLRDVGKPKDGDPFAGF